MTLAEAPARRPLFDRILFALPVVGLFARAIDRDVNAFFWLLPIIVLGIVLAVQTWGFAALTMVALACVPLMFAFFVAVCWPF